MRKPQTKIDSQLLSSLKVLSSIIEDEKPNVLLKNGLAIAQSQYNIMSIGEPIQEDLLACPNGILLKEALAKCGQSFSITQLEHKLSIKSDKFRALIPCISIEDFQVPFPDPPIASIDDRLKNSLAAVAPLALDENSVVTASVLIHGGCITATDRKVILQSYHGIDLPPMLTLPKTIIKPLIKNTKKLKSFGYSNSSCTFYYEDGSWFKSQYFADTWPDVAHILDKPVSAWPIPEDFYKAVNALAPFSEGDVYFKSNMMYSHKDIEAGASYEVYGLPDGPIINIKQLKMIEPFIKTVDFLVPHHNHKMMIFHGQNIRGAIAGRV